MAVEDFQRLEGCSEEGDLVGDLLADPEVNQGQDINLGCLEPWQGHVVEHVLWNR